MQKIIPDAVRVALCTVANAANAELNYGAGCREVNNPLSVTNHGLARRFEPMSDGMMTRYFRRLDADVAFLVYYGLADVLSGKHELLQSLTVEQLADGPITLGRVTAAALRAVEHYDRTRDADILAPDRKNRIAKFFA